MAEPLTDDDVRRICREEIRAQIFEENRRAQQRESDAAAAWLAELRAKARA